MLKMTDNQQRFISGFDIGRLLRPFAGLAVPAGAVIAALVVGAILLGVFGANPLTGYRELFTGAFGGPDELAATALKSIPLMLVGVGICIAFRTGVINIGGEGQIIMGAILATLVALALPDVPRPVLVPLVMIAGGVGGGIWGAIPGALKAYSGVNEILSTIMMNIIAGFFMSFLLEDWLIEPGAIRIQQTKRLSQNADLPILPGGTRLHLGIVVALDRGHTRVLAVVPQQLGHAPASSGPQPPRLPGRGHESRDEHHAGFGLQRGLRRYRWRSVGVRERVAPADRRGRPAGIHAECWIQRHRDCVVRRAAPAVHGAVVVFVRRDAGRRHLLQRAVQVPQALVIALNGVVVVFVVGSLKLRARVQRWAEGDIQMEDRA